MVSFVFQLNTQHTPRACGKTILILVLTLLHLCVRAQALNTAARDPPHHRPPIPRESDRWSETRHRLTLGLRLRYHSWSAAFSPPEGSDKGTQLQPVPTLVHAVLARESDWWRATRHCCTPELETSSNRPVHTSHPGGAEKLKGRTDLKDVCT